MKYNEQGIKELIKLYKHDLSECEQVIQVLLRMIDSWKEKEPKFMGITIADMHDELALLQAEQVQLIEKIEELKIKLQHFFN